MHKRIIDNHEEGVQYAMATGDRVVTVCFDDTMNKRIMEALPAYVEQMLFLTPAWVRLLVFDFEHNAEEGSSHTVPAYLTAQDDYLYAHITLSDSWLSESDYDRAFTLMHEFIHLHESPTYHFARRCLEELMSPGADSPRSEPKLIMQEYLRKYEAQTQELTHVMMNRLWPDINAALQASARHAVA